MHPARNFPVGEGGVEIDVGPSTIAAVGKDDALLAALRGEAGRKHLEIRRLQTRLGEQRRANNRPKYLPGGPVRLGAGDGQGPHDRDTEDVMGELYRREAAPRDTLREPLANWLLAMVKVVQTEKAPLGACRYSAACLLGWVPSGKRVDILRCGEKRQRRGDQMSDTQGEVITSLLRLRHGGKGDAFAASLLGVPGTVCGGNGLPRGELCGSTLVGWGTVLTGGATELRMRGRGTGVGAGRPQKRGQDASRLRTSNLRRTLVVGGGEGLQRSSAQSPWL